MLKRKDSLLFIPGGTAVHPMGPILPDIWSGEPNDVGFAPSSEFPGFWGFHLGKYQARIIWFRPNTLSLPTEARTLGSTLFNPFASLNFMRLST